MATIICPNCRSSNVRRSHTHGIKERLLKLIGKKAFRCRDCGWRGLVFSGSAHSSRVTLKQSNVFGMILAAILLALIVLFFVYDEQIEELARTIFGIPK